MATDIFIILLHFLPVSTQKNQKICQSHKNSVPLRSQTFGKMAEWSIASVLKTDEGHTSGGSNPSLSAHKGCKSCICSPFSPPIPDTGQF